MVIGAFPIAKLGTLLIRQVSKPLANYLISRAKTSPFFRNYICMPPAQFYNWCEVKTKMWVMNLGKPVNVPILNETMAIELGSNLLGEAVIFTVAASVLFFEYNRQQRKEAAKEQTRKEEIEALHFTIQELYFQMERQDTQIREISRKQMDIESGLVRFRWPIKNQSNEKETNSTSTKQTSNDNKTSIISKAIQHSENILIFR